MPNHLASWSTVNTHTHSKCTKAFTTECESERQHFAFREHALTNTHKEPHQGAQAGISDRAVYRWATLQGDTVTFQKRMVLV